MQEYITLGNLKVYQLSIKLSDMSWGEYKDLGWQIKKTIGDQFITSIDSIGANIAEGYGRFHYLDKARFYYNARGSLLEAKHWAYLFYKREFFNEEKFYKILSILDAIHRGLNELIKSTKNRKNFDKIIS